MGENIITIKLAMELKLFQKKNMLFFYILQKSMFYNDPPVLPKMITLE